MEMKRSVDKCSEGLGEQGVLQLLEGIQIILG